jgi:hypothetical protein
VLLPLLLSLQVTPSAAAAAVASPSGGLSQWLPPSVTTNSTAGALLLLLLPFRVMVALSHLPGAEVTCTKAVAMEYSS